MKTAFQFVTLVFAFVAFAACSKNDGANLTAEELSAQYLTGSGNKVWRLKAVKVNDVPQALTTHQAQYTKTYTMPAPKTVQGTFVDSDNYHGDWSMKGAIALQETFQQIGGTGYGRRDYVILSLDAHTLSAYYVSNNSKIEELYNAY